MYVQCMDIRYTCVYTIYTRIYGVYRIPYEHRIPALSTHFRYVWSDIAERTVKVYEEAMQLPPVTWMEGLRRYV